MISLYEELAAYLGRPLKLVIERCKYAYIELAWQWEQYKVDPLAYYRESELYMFDLTMYQQMLRDQGFHNWLVRVLKDFKIKTMLDYGGGIGEYTILAWQNGVPADFMDVDGKTKRYAAHRFVKHGIHPIMINESATLQTYDLIVAMDVFEHIPNCTPVIKEVAEKCKYMICNTPEELPYNEFYPQHISHIEEGMGLYFEHVADKLWKSKLFQK